MRHGIISQAIVECRSGTAQASVRAAKYIQTTTKSFPGTVQRYQSSAEWFGGSAEWYKSATMSFKSNV